MIQKNISEFFEYLSNSAPIKQPTDYILSRELRPLNESQSFKADIEPDPLSQWPFSKISKKGLTSGETDEY